MLRFAAACMVMPQVAMAVPMTMTHSGRLLDAAGGPLNGTHAITVNLYDGSSALQWGDTFSDVRVQDGYFAVVLGSGVALDAADLSADTLYVGVSVDGGAEMRSDTPLSSVPFAVRAEDSRNVRGGVVEATTISGTSVSASTVVADTVDVGALSVDTIDVGGVDLGAPIVGEWFPAHHRTSWISNAYQFMTFDQERFNTDPTYFTYDGVDTITVHKAGWYRVDMRTITHNSGEGNHVETWKGGARLHLSHSMYNNSTGWRRHATSVVAYFDAGETLQVRVYCRNTTVTYCYHAGPDYTALTLQRIR